MKNEALGFDDGLVEFDVNGKAKIVINPTDADFFGGIYNAFTELAKRQDAIEGERKSVDPERVFEYTRKVSNEMREVIDGVFAPVCNVGSICAALFGSMNLYAMAGGLPVWCNFLFAVMDKADVSIAVEQKLTDPAIKKYTKRYHR